MKKLILAPCGLVMALGMATVVGAPAWAQEWPARTVTILVPYPAGGVADAVARAVATQATTELKQSFVVENRTGASGRIALDQLIRAAPDGYTLALAVPALLSLLPITDPKYVDLDKKVTPITIAVETYFGFAVNPQKTPAKTFQELMTSAKAKSGQLTYSSAGAGTSYHFWSEAILKEAGVNATHVPYRGEAPATTDLLAGVVDFTLVTGAGKGLAEDNKIKILAVSAPKSWDIYPAAPSLNDVGVKQAVAAGWLGFMGPPGMSKELTAKVNAVFLSALKRPEVQTMLSTQGYTVVASPPEAMPAVVVKEQEIFRDLLKSGRVKLEQQ